MGGTSGMVAALLAASASAVTDAIGRRVPLAKARAA